VSDSVNVQCAVCAVCRDRVAPVAASLMSELELSTVCVYYCTARSWHLSSTDDLSIYIYIPILLLY